MREESADVVQYVHHARLIVDDRDGGSTEPEAADATGAVEIERNVVLGQVAVLEFGVNVHESHAEAAGVHGLRLATLPDAAAVLLDQIADRDAHRKLDAFRLVHVPGNGVQFRPVAAGVARVLRIGGNAE